MSASSGTGPGAGAGSASAGGGAGAGTGMYHEVNARTAARAAGVAPVEPSSLRSSRYGPET